MIVIDEIFRILIVDDNREIGLILEECLRAEGYVVESACDWKEALSKHGEAGYDLIITDLDMPEMTGVGPIEKIAKGKKVPELIIISGPASVDTATEAVKIGDTDYFKKPFRIQDLKMVVKRAKGRKILEKANSRDFDEVKSFSLETSRVTDD